MQQSNITFSKMFQEIFPELVLNEKPNRMVNKLQKTLSFHSLDSFNIVNSAKSPQVIMISNSPIRHIYSSPFTIEEWEKLFSLNSPDSIDKERLLLSLKSGISNQIRGKVWMLISKSFLLSLSYAKNYYENLLTESVPEAESLINKDVPRTFLYATSDKIIDIQSQSTKLFNILKAFSVYDKEISYCQGMNTLAATLLQLIGNEAYCFWTFIAIMHQNKWRDFYKRSTPKLFRMLEILKKNFIKAMPDLYAHLEEVKASQYFDMIFSHFFITLFTYNSPFDFSIKVIDLFWIYEEKALFDVIIKIVLIKKDKLMQMAFEELVTYLKNDIVFDVAKEVDINMFMSTAI